MLLPGLLLRALVPVGFMPMVGPGHHVQLVVCESFAPMPASMSADASMDMPMDKSMDMPASDTPDHRPTPSDSGGPSPHRQSHGDCPYGSSPAWAALPVLSIPAVVVLRFPSPAAAGNSQISYSEVSPLAPSPRGPPV